MNRFAISALVLTIFISFHTQTKAARFTIANHDVAALSQAIIASKSNQQPDTIVLALKGSYTVKTPVTSFDQQDGALPDIWEDSSSINSLTILGNGSVIERDLTANGFRIFSVITGTVNMYDLHIRNGSTVLDNGSGIRNQNAVLKLYNCTLSNNRGSFLGGGIYTGSSATTSLTGCTITTCEAAGGSALYYYQGVGDIINCTISGNDGKEAGTAAVASAIPSFVNYDYIVRVTNSIIAGNKDKNGAESDISGAVLSGGHNIIGAVNDVNTQIYFPAGNPTNAGDYTGKAAIHQDPQVSPLGDYGGLTPTMPLLSVNSTGVNKPNNNSLAPIYDQAGNNRSGNAEIGSMEFINDFPFLNPVILVTKNDTIITTKTGIVNLPATAPGSASTGLNLKIKNTNTSTYKLHLLASPLAVIIEGSNAADFVIVQDTLRKAIPGGSSTAFQVVFKPQSAGFKTALVRIASNDATNTIYEFTIQGISAITTALDDHTFGAGISISPNPSGGQFTVQMPAGTQSTHITIADLSGKTIYSEALNADGTVDLRNAVPGVYMLRIETATASRIEKLVID